MEIIGLIDTNKNFTLRRKDGIAKDAKVSGGAFANLAPWRENPEE